MFLSEQSRHKLIEFLIQAKQLSEYRRDPCISNKFIDELMVELGCEKDVVVLVVEHSNKLHTYKTVEYEIANSKEEAIKQYLNVYSKIKPLQSPIPETLKIISVQNWRRGM